MPIQLAPPLPSGCPWSSFTPPNVDWCEVERCAVIVNPIDAWSNALYLVLGLWMWRATRRGGRADLARFGPAGVAVGVFSFAYHASYTFALQFFDFVAMFLFTFTVLARNAVRLGWIRPARETLFFALGVLGLSALVPPLFYAGFPIQALVGLLIAVGLAQEWRLRRRDGPMPAYRIYLVGLALLGAASVASLLDVTRVVCDPESWLQGHAVWHVLSALSLAAFFRFYAELGSDSALKGGTTVESIGGCHCGAIRYQVQGKPDSVALCHCVDCRKNSGAPVMAWAGYPEAKLTVTKGNPKVFKSSASSQRSFCGDCGTGLFYRNADFLPGIVELQASTLDDPESVVPTLQIQVAERLGWMKTAHQIQAIDRFPG